MNVTRALSLEDLRAEALSLVNEAVRGEPLDEATAALIRFSLRISVTALDVDEARDQAHRALDEGITSAQLHEVLLLVSGLGVHSLFKGSPLLASMAGGSVEAARAPLDDARQVLWDRLIGSDSYWAGLEAEVPGFLTSLLRQSPEGFEAFVAYCAVPWKSGLVPARTKELISMAVDAAPTHRFLPGMRLHLRNALRLGAGQRMILGALDLAAEAPLHAGTR